MKTNMPKVISILASLWFVFAVMHELLTGNVWFWVLPGMSPPVLFAIIPIVFFLIGIFIGQNRTLILVLAISSFAISNQSTGINFAAFIPRTDSYQRSSNIKIVQMNTDYWGQLREGTLTDPRDKDSMLAYLNKLDADVYLLQEHMQRDGNFAPPITDLSDVKEAFPEYEAITAGTLLTLTRLPVISKSVVNQDTNSDIHLPPPPYSLRVDVQVGAEIMSTYNVHMPIQIIIEKNWFSKDFYFEIWRRHFIRQDEYQVLTSNVVANPYPLVIAGDFNTSPAMGDNRMLLEVTRDAASAGGDLYPSTWRVGGQLPRFWRNDWFLVRNNIEVVNFESLDPEGNSDHLVQSVKLALKGSVGQSKERK